MPNAPNALPPLEDPKLAAKAKPEINLAEVEKSFRYWSKPYNLESYETYHRISVRAARKHASLILCKVYFKCGFRLPIPTLTSILLNYLRKSSCQLT